jgi:heptosyltransferase-2
MKLVNKLERWLKLSFLRLLEKAIKNAPVHPDNLPRHQIRRILIIRQHDQLGDLLLATPVFRAVRENFPEAHISALVRSYTSQILYNNIYLNEVISFYERFTDWSPKKAVQFFKRLRSNFDLAIVLNTVSHSVTSDLLAWLSGAKYRLGSEHLIFEGCQSNFLYNLRASYHDSNKHQTEKNLDIVRFIQIDTKNKSEEINLNQGELDRAKAMLGRHKIKGKDLIVAMHPGAGKVRNRWEVNRFKQVAKYFNFKYNAKIVVSWGPQEQELGNEFLNGLPFTPVEAVDLNLRELSAVFAWCHLLICNDTGVMHLAASVGTPLVAIFGPTDPEQWKPLGQKFVALKGEDNSCASVAVEEVIAEAEKLLGLNCKAEIQPEETVEANWLL